MYHTAFVVFRTWIPIRKQSFHMDCVLCSSALIINSMLMALTGKLCCAHTTGVALYSNSESSVVSYKSHTRVHPQQYASTLLVALICVAAFIFRVFIYHLSFCHPFYRRHVFFFFYFLLVLAYSRSLSLSRSHHLHLCLGRSVVRQSTDHPTVVPAMME